MVTKTTNDDDLPTHDAFGTDLRRVRTMLDRGFAESLIAECLGIDTNRARHAVIVATDDRQGAPTPEEIAQRCAEIQAGWTPEQAAQAKHGEPRLSSRVARPHSITREERSRIAIAAAAKRMAERVASGKVSVRFYPDIKSERKWQSRPCYRGRNGRRMCVTEAEAIAWGQDWLVKQHERDAEASCCGK